MPTRRTARKFRWGGLGADHPDVIALADSTVLVAWTQKEKVGEAARTSIRIVRVW